MMQFETEEVEYELVEIYDLSDFDVRCMCQDACDKYCRAVLASLDADEQQACADALLEFVEEARWRGIMPGWFH